MIYFSSVQVEKSLTLFSLLLTISTYARAVIGLFYPKSSLTIIFLSFLSHHLIRRLQNVGIDKGDIPDLTKAPSSLLDALEGHLATIEGRKTSAANTPTQSSRYHPFTWCPMAMTIPIIIF